MSTLVEIGATDRISDSRAVINTNFETLNTDKAEGSSLTTHIADTTTHGTTGDVVGTSDTQVLTNKTLTSPTITTPVVNGAVTGTVTPPKTFYGSNFNAPEGFLINGLIVPSVASNNLTVAIKGMDGNDPSATNPVYCRINGVVRSITGALTVSAPDGINWCNSGGAELATKEVDYFTYLQWDTVASAVKLGFARIPYGTLVSDFNATGTNEKSLLGYANFTATDSVVNIGRFAATLSAGAGYTWTVPTFTATNLIQRPIYETRWLTWQPTFTGYSGSPTTNVARYQLASRIVRIKISMTGTSNSADFAATVPFTAASTGYYEMGLAVCIDNSVALAGASRMHVDQSQFTLSIDKTLAAPSGFTAGGTKALLGGKHWYEI